MALCSHWFYPSSPNSTLWFFNRPKKKFFGYSLIWRYWAFAPESSFLDLAEVCKKVADQWNSFEASPQ